MVDPAFPRDVETDPNLKKSRWLGWMMMNRLDNVKPAGGCLWPGPVRANFGKTAWLCPDGFCFFTVRA